MKPVTRLAADMQRAYYQRDSELLLRLMERADTLPAALAADGGSRVRFERDINAHFAGNGIKETS